MVRPLTITTLFPSALCPHHGVFVENRLRHLRESTGTESRIIAPIPWFPFQPARFENHGAFAATPLSEVRHKFQIDHPRFLTIPKFGMTVQPYFYYRAIRGTVRKIVENEGPFDLIDAHYMYPDGVAAALIARDLKMPLAITVRGTDINLIPQYTLPRRWIKWAIHRASHLIAVCEALKVGLIDLGAEPSKVEVLRNGVDLALFRPMDRQQARSRHHVGGKILLSVGALIERKGMDLIIDAMTDLADFELLIAGDGPSRVQLETRAKKHGVSERVRFLGSVAHRDLPELYNAADISILASSREGWANVLLESMACGTPVIASNVWGTPEVVRGPESGLLLEDRSVRSIVDAVRKLERNPPERSATRLYAEQFSWEATSEGQRRIFEKLAGTGR